MRVLAGRSWEGRGNSDILRPCLQACCGLLPGTDKVLVTSEVCHNLGFPDQIKIPFKDYFSVTCRLTDEGRLLASSPLHTENVVKVPCLNPGLPLASWLCDFKRVLQVF